MELFIYCAGGSGREVLDFAVTLNGISKRWERISFIDDIIKEKNIRGAAVFRYEEALQKMEDGKGECIISSGEPFVRKILYEKLVNDHVSLANLVSPYAFISPGAVLGRGIMIMDQVSVSDAATIRDNVSIKTGAIIGHDSILGEHSVLSANSFVGGRTELEECVYAGVGCLIKECLHIGYGSVLALGCAVHRNVKAEKIVMGNPARVIGDNESHKVFGVHNADGGEG